MRSLAATMLACLSMVVPAAASDIRDYDMRIRVAASGNADVAGRVRIDGAGRTVIVPVGFTSIDGLRLIDAPAGTTVTVHSAGRQMNLVLRFTGEPTSPVEVSFTFGTSGLLPAAAPGTRQMLRYSLLNSQPDTIRSYVVRLMLPSGLRAHAVREALPRLRPNEPGPRVELGRIDDGTGAVLRGASLAQGDIASVQIETTPAARSPLWLYAGALLSALYLVSFRDLVTAADSTQTRTT